MASEQNRSITTMVVLVIVAVIIAGVAFFYLRPAPEEEKEKPLVMSVPNPQAESAVAERKPITPAYEAPTPEPQQEPLPALSESDASVLSGFDKLTTEATKLIVPDEVIRKFVRAVNAAEESKVVHEYRPLVSPAPPFQVELHSTATDQARQYKLSPKNYQRYDQYVSALTKMDTDALVAVYKRFYPLLEEAYGEMGLKKGNFHTVMLAAIDNLLAAPVIDGDILLVRPKVFYQYADPQLEKLPATHKLLLRMGPENARSVKARLKELRDKLAK